MSQINTLPSLVDELVALGVRPGMVVMAHSSLRQVGWTVGGPVTVVRALQYDAIREHQPIFDPQTTPTTMGAIAETFRTYPDTRRSNHPLVSVCANGRRAEEITAEQSMEF